MEVNQNPIPVLGIPILNGFKWIKRLIESIDYPIDNVVIINNNGREQQMKNDLEELVKQSSPYVKNMNVVHFPSNMGVSFSWNFIIKSYMMEPYWLISNHDVAFTPGLLEEIAHTALTEGIGMIHPSAGEFNLGTYDLFMIRDWVIQEVGLFDENLYPAYGEDTDYIMRLHNFPIWSVRGLSKVHLHGNLIANDENYLEQGQQTKKESSNLNEKLVYVNSVNFDYLEQKWGKDWQTVSPYKHPMNNSSIDRRYTTFNLWYARTKYLGL
jgi:hypothetical protein